MTERDLLIKINKKHVARAWLFLLGAVLLIAAVAIQVMAFGWFSILTIGSVPITMWAIREAI